MERVTLDLYFLCFIIGYYSVFATLTLTLCPNTEQGKVCTIKCESSIVVPEVVWDAGYTSFTLTQATCTTAPWYTTTCSDGLKFVLTFTANRTRDRGPWRCWDGLGVYSKTGSIIIDVPPSVGSLTSSRLVRGEKGFINCTTDATIPAVTDGLITVNGKPMDTAKGTTTSKDDLFIVAFTASKVMPDSGTSVQVACQVTYKGDKIKIATETFDLNSGDPQLCGANCGIGSIGFVAGLAAGLTNLKGIIPEGNAKKAVIGGLCAWSILQLSMFIASMVVDALAWDLSVCIAGFTLTMVGFILTVVTAAIIFKTS